MKFLYSIMIYTVLAYSCSMKGSERNSFVQSFDEKTWTDYVEFLNGSHVHRFIELNLESLQNTTQALIKVLEEEESAESIFETSEKYSETLSYVSNALIDNSPKELQRMSEVWIRHKEKYTTSGSSSPTPRPHHSLAEEKNAHARALGLQQLIAIKRMLVNKWGW